MIQEKGLKAIDQEKSYDDLKGTPQISYHAQNILKNLTHKIYKFILGYYGKEFRSLQLVSSSNLSMMYAVFWITLHKKYILDCSHVCDFSRYVDGGSPSHGCNPSL